MRLRKRMTKMAEVVLNEQLAEVAHSAIINAVEEEGTDIVSQAFDVITNKFVAVKSANITINKSSSDFSINENESKITFSLNKNFEEMNGVKEVLKEEIPNYSEQKKYISNMNDELFSVTFSDFDGAEFDAGVYLDLYDLQLNEDEEDKMRENVNKKLNIVFQNYIQNVIESISESIDEVALNMDIKQIAEEIQNMDVKSNEDRDFEIGKTYQLSEKICNEIVKRADFYAKQ